ncbi:MAG: hypothetical protein Q4E49_00855 [Bacteroidales bacterium]|nr:hypothetical protein [Bacteroidales bacterium]
MKRADDYEFLKNSIKTKDLPSDYNYQLDKRKKNLILTVREKGLKANMQDNESAFESWAIVLKFYCSKLIKTVTIDWEDFSTNGNNKLHYNRFIYRLTKFIQTYEWANSAKQIPPIPSVLVCNIPNGEAADKDKHQIGSETWIECEYVEKHRNDYDSINHQLPVGIFYDKVSNSNYYTTGKKSAIDIWAIKDKILNIFELKKPGNNVLGIISELMFYSNIFNDILSHRILYQESAKMKKIISSNIRGFGDLYKAYQTGYIQNINGIMLTYSMHPLITQELIDFINMSGRLNFCRIHYSIKKADIQVP